MKVLEGSLEMRQMAAKVSALALLGSVLALTHAIAQPLAAPAANLAATPAIRAELVDPVKKAAKGWATVQTEVVAINMVDPAAAADMPRKGEGHLHYQVDRGPVVATTAEKLSFHDLTRGKHTITVTLVGNDHLPLAVPIVLALTVP